MSAFSLGAAYFCRSSEDMSNLLTELRWAIISYWKGTRNVAATSRAIEVSDKSMRLWDKRYDDTAHVLDKLHSCRKPILSDAVCATGLGLPISPTFGDASSVAR